MQNRCKVATHKVFVVKVAVVGRMYEILSPLKSACWLPLHIYVPDWIHVPVPEFSGYQKSNVKQCVLDLPIKIWNFSASQIIIKSHFVYLENCDAFCSPPQVE